jgi:hypothetical protein
MALEITMILENQVVPQERHLEIGLEISLEISAFFGYFIIQEATGNEFRILHVLLKHWGRRNLKPLAEFEVQEQQTRLKVLGDSTALQVGQ